MSNDTNNYDPFDAMNDAKEPSSHFFGLNNFDSYFCVLEKGRGKVPFDTQIHDAGRRRTSIQITISPLPSSNAQYNLERNCIAESKDWTGTILPSIHTLGLTPRDLQDKYVHVELVKVGSYEKDGETKSKTMPKYVAVYNSEQECERAAAEFFGNGHTDTEQQPVSNGNTTAGSSNEALEKFVEILVKDNVGDEQKITEALAKSALLSKHFTIDSKEVRLAIFNYKNQAAIAVTDNDEKPF